MDRNIPLKGISQYVSRWAGVCIQDVKHSILKNHVYSWQCLLFFRAVEVPKSEFQIGGLSYYKENMGDVWVRGSVCEPLGSLRAKVGNTCQAKLVRLLFLYSSLSSLGPLQPTIIVERKWTCLCWGFGEWDGKTALRLKRFTAKEKKKNKPVWENSHCTVRNETPKDPQIVSTKETQIPLHYFFFYFLRLGLTM